MGLGDNAWSLAEDDEVSLSPPRPASDSGPFLHLTGHEQKKIPLGLHLRLMERHSPEQREARAQVQRPTRLLPSVPPTLPKRGFDFLHLLEVLSLRRPQGLGCQEGGSQMWRRHIFKVYLPTNPTLRPKPTQMTGGPGTEL